MHRDGDVIITDVGEQVEDLASQLQPAASTLGQHRQLLHQLPLSHLADQALVSFHR